MTKDAEAWQDDDFSWREVLRRSGSWAAAR